MSITRVNKLGTTNNTGTGLSSLTLTVAATTTTRNRIIVPIFWGAANRTAAVTDSQGNGYTQDIVTVGAPGAGGFATVFSARGDVPLTSGVDTIRVTWTGGTVNDALMAAYEYSGLANFSPVDLTQSGTGLGTSVNSGNLVTTFANELIFGLIGWSTVGALTAHSYTELDKVAGGTHSFETQENIVSATGTYAVTGTLAPNPDWASIAIGYSDTVNGTPVAPSSTTAPAITGSGVVGMQLTCSQGVWTNTPTAYAYQWKRDGSNIATGAHYRVVAADVGHVLSCAVSASNKYGSVAATASNTVTPAVNKVQSGMGI